MTNAHRAIFQSYFNEKHMDCLGHHKETTACH